MFPPITAGQVTVLSSTSNSRPTPIAARDFDEDLTALSELAPPSNQAASTSVNLQQNASESVAVSSVPSQDSGIEVDGCAQAAETASIGTVGSSLGTFPMAVAPAISGIDVGISLQTASAVLDSQSGQAGIQVELPSPSFLSPVDLNGLSQISTAVFSSPTASADQAVTNGQMVVETQSLSPLIDSWIDLSTQMTVDAQTSVISLLSHTTSGEQTVSSGQTSIETQTSNITKDAVLAATLSVTGLPTPVNVPTFQASYISGETASGQVITGAATLQSPFLSQTATDSPLLITTQNGIVPSEIGSASQSNIPSTNSLNDESTVSPDSTPSLPTDTLANTTPSSLALTTASIPNSPSTGGSASMTFSSSMSAFTTTGTTNIVSSSSLVSTSSLSEPSTPSSLQIFTFSISSSITSDSSSISSR